MNFNKTLTIGVVLAAFGVGGPAVALASDDPAPDAPSLVADEADGQNNDLATQVEAANVDEDQQGQEGTDEADGANNDLASEIEDANVDEAQEGTDEADGANGDLATTDGTDGASSTDG